MAINTLTFASKLTEELDKVFVQAPVTGFLADNVLRAKFVGAKTVLIPELGMSGLADYDRDTGFTRGAISVPNTAVTMSMDRARSFQIDREDDDETGIAGLAGQVLGEFVRTKVVPEVDAYVLSKLAGLAVTKSHTVTGTPASEAYKMFSTAVSNVQDKVGYEEPLVCFVGKDFYTALQNSAEFSRYMIVSDFKKGELCTKVRTINDVAILPVSNERMKTAYTFYDGVTSGEEAGGFVPTSTAKTIGMLVMPKKAASLVKKTEKIRTFTPDQNQDADAYKLDYRAYYDVFVKNSMSDAIYAYVA